MVDAILHDVRQWADSITHISAVLLVGSFAHGTARMTSDLDLVVVTHDREALQTDTSWTTALIGEAPLVREKDWGPLRELRFRRTDGFEIEFGITDPSWLSVPLDPGTRRVLGDGARVLLDRDGLVADALRELREQSAG